MSRRNAALRFDKTRCERCGADRVLEQPCADCGSPARPGETNAPAVLRRQACLKVDEAVVAEPTQQEARDVETLIDELAGWPERFLSDLGALIQRPDSHGATALGGTISTIRRVLAEARNITTERPVVLAQAVVTVAEELSRLWPVYRDALITSDVAYAQALGAQAQLILDAAETALIDARRVDRAASVLHDEAGIPVLLDRIMSAIEVRHGAKDLGEHASFGAARAADASGVRVSDTDGLDFLCVELVADAYLDGGVFRTKVRECSEAFDGTSRLAELAAVPGSLDDLARARREVFEAAQHCMHVLNVERDPDAAFRRIARTVSELYENSGPLWAWAAALLPDGSQPPKYKTVRQSDATDNVRRVARVLPSTSADAPAYLRHAGAHGGSITLDSELERVELSLRSHPETLELREYLNRVLAFVESVLALNWSLGNFLSSGGFPVSMSDADAGYFGLTKEGMAEFWLKRAKGYHVVLSGVHHGVWTIDASIPREEVFPTGVVLAIQAGPNVVEVQVRATGSSGPPIELFLDTWLEHNEAFQDAGEPRRLLLLAELRRKLRRGDQPLLRHSDLVAALVAQALPVLKLESHEVSGLRRIREIAIEFGWSDLAALAVKVIQVVRTGEPSDAIASIQPLVATLQESSDLATDAIVVRLDAQK